MPRLLIQSTATGRFLVPSCEFPHSPEWVASLKDAGPGILSDYEAAHYLIEEYAEVDEFCSIVDLDIFGTINDV